VARVIKKKSKIKPKKRRKKMEQNINESILVSKALRKLGFSVRGIKHKNANGPDCYAIGKDKCLSVEIKVARQQSKSAYSVRPVEQKRKGDDLVAIVLGNYVLIEPMKQHLKNCSAKGYRMLGELRSG
jgi:uncharacterized UPF0146 family protein